MRFLIAEDLALLRDGLVRLLRDNGFPGCRRMLSAFAVSPESPD